MAFTLNAFLSCRLYNVDWLGRCKDYPGFWTPSCKVPYLCMGRTLSVKVNTITVITFLTTRYKRVYAILLLMISEDQIFGQRFSCICLTRVVPTFFMFPVTFRWFKFGFNAYIELFRSFSHRFFLASLQRTLSGSHHRNRPFCVSLWGSYLLIETFQTNVLPCAH